jgi:hypothetical protein
MMDQRAVPLGVHAENHRPMTGRDQSEARNFPLNSAAPLSQSLEINRSKIQLILGISPEEAANHNADGYFEIGVTVAGKPKEAISSKTYVFRLAKLNGRIFGFGFDH